MNKTDHPLYKTWIDIKRRCNNPNYKDYPHYGARGVKVCQRWLDNFWNFVEDMGERPKNHSIDRINVNGNYEPSNCRWATVKEQNFNKQKPTITITFKGKTLTEKEWAEEIGISYAAFRMRKSARWSIEKILTTAPRKRSK